MNDNVHQVPGIDAAGTVTGRSGLPWPFKFVLVMLILGVVIPLQFILAPGIYFLGFQAMPVAICLAVAGKGNRLLFSGVLVVVGVLGVAALAALTRSGLADHNIAAGLFLFGAGPLLPALLMWLAHLLKMRRLRRQSAGGDPPGTAFVR